MTQAEEDQRLESLTRYGDSAAVRKRSRANEGFFGCRGKRNKVSRFGANSDTVQQPSRKRKAEAAAVISFPARLRLGPKLLAKFPHLNR